MDPRIVTEPQQGTTYDDLLAVAQAAESLGPGAGWFEAEHRAHGIPFPPLGESFDRLEEPLAVITGLWATEPLVVSPHGHDVDIHRLPM